MQVRYVRTAGTIVLPDEAETNIMLYGYLPGESGHQNRRMLLPAALRGLGTLIMQAGLPMPVPDDFALLEWPTPADPDFRLSFLEPSGPIGLRAANLFATAQSSGGLVGDGACWLQPHVAPAW
jgi:hypothetical protein